MVMSGTFDQLLTYMGFCLGIFPIVAVLGLFKLRRTAGRTYRMPLFPLAPVVFVSASVSILVLAYLERPIESSIALGTVALGIPVYLYFKKLRARTVPAIGGGA